MKKIILLLFIGVLYACAEKAKPLTAQNIIDKAIEASGGELYKERKVSFFFRAKEYVSEMNDGRTSFTRISTKDGIKTTDILNNNSFKRFLNDSLITVADSMTTRYSNAINSVHYFARLPYGLNATAAHKELMGEVSIKNKEYYKIKVTFDQENGGVDFEDTYIYWFNKETYAPDYLAYEFHVDGGGIRFREAFNERFVNNIRFVDYNNLKPKNKEASLYEIESLFVKGELKLLSKIELDSIKLSPLH